MAAFVVGFNWTPADYYAMSVAERDAILTEARRQRSK